MQLISSGGFYGAENVVLQLSIALRKLGCSVVIGAFQNRQNPNTDVAKIAKRHGFEVELFDCAGKFDRATIRAIRECIQRRKIQVLHAHGYKANFYGLLATHKGSVRQVSTPHNWLGKTIPLRIYGVLDRLLLRRADHICAVSPDTEAKLRRSGTPADKLSLIENGVDIEQFSSGKPVLRELPMFRDKVIIGFVGRIVWDKGLRVLLEAAKEITRVYSQAVFVLAGEGPDRTDVESLSAELGLNEKVHFLGQRSDLPDVYASLDMFVLPSFVEAMPMVLLEAMSAGKPVIATPIGGVPKLIRDRENGILVETGDAGSLTKAIIRLMKEPELAQKIAQRGSEDVSNHYSAESMARRYLAVYEKVLMCKSGQVAA